MKFINETNIDFLAKRKPAFVASILIIVTGIVFTIMSGGPNYSIDFLGGAELTARFSDDAPIGEIRSSLSSAGYESPEVKLYGNPSDVLIRVEQQGVGVNSGDAIMNHLKKNFASLNPVKLSVDEVGPKIGREMRGQVLWAIFFALALILVYIWIRFELVFGVGAIIALFHDISITFGVFAILGFELSISVIAAFLTIVGYSLNDTIVIFDRIRENVKKMRREEFENILNISINQSLSRTIVTSMTTFIVVLVLYLFGGEVLKNFSFALLVGVIVGTYSSIFVATPVVAGWHKYEAQKNDKRPSKKRK